jgi:hypothetical protein
MSYCRWPLTGDRSAPRAAGARGPLKLLEAGVKRVTGRPVLIICRAATRKALLPLCVMHLRHLEALSSEE